MSDVLDDVTDALAVYRLTKLVNDDYVTEPIRERIYRRFGEPSDSKISYLVGCPWCVSIYTGAFVVAARKISPTGWSRVARALAFSAMTGLIAERE